MNPPELSNRSRSARRTIPFRLVRDPAGDADLARGREIDERAPRQRDVRRHARSLARDRILRDLDDELLPFLDELVDARPRRAGRRAVGLAGRLDVLCFEIELLREGILHVQERVALVPDRDERGLHTGQDAVDPGEVRVSDEALLSAPLVEHLDGAPLLAQGDSRLGRSRVDEQLLAHALANRRYSTPRIRPMARNVVAIEEPP
jgi:hypothetical protein